MDYLISEAFMRVSALFLTLVIAVCSISASALGAITIADAKSAPDNAPVTLEGYVVTTSPGELPSRMYIEDSGRSCGIQIYLGSSSPAGVSEGSVVTVSGTITTRPNGERAVAYPIVTVTGSSPAIEPVAVRNRMIGGTSFGFQSGVRNGLGTNNIGILIRTWGWVSSVDPSGGYATIDDGSGIDIRIDISRLINKPRLREYLLITGIVSTYAVADGDLIPLVVPRRPNDVNPSNPYCETQLATAVPEGKVALHWLGQGGWMLRDHEGRRIAIDPLLSDYKRSTNPDYVRMMLIPVPPEKLKPGLTLLTHRHGDHADPWSLNAIQSSSQSVFWGPATVTTRLKQIGILSSRCKTIYRGQVYTWNGVEITPVYANHPYDTTLDAVGYVIVMGRKKIYVSGDTLYDQTLSGTVLGEHPDVILVCINGDGGNMSAPEAALLVKTCNPQVTIPMHYGMFAINTVDPEAFVTSCQQQGVASQVIVLPACGYIVL